MSIYIRPQDDIDTMDAMQDVIDTQKAEIERLRALLAEYETVMGLNTPFSPPPQS